jgi:hypothetical protein
MGAFRGESPSRRLNRFRVNAHAWRILLSAVIAPSRIPLGEVSCLDAAFVDGFVSALVAVGRWGSNEVLLYAMPDLRLLGEAKSEVSHPASVRIQNSQVLVGLGNGTLVTYDIKKCDSPELGVRRILTLGIEPLLLASCAIDLEIEGEKQIVALSERVSVIYSERGRLMASSISGKVGSKIVACEYQPLMFLVFRVSLR